VWGTAAHGFGKSEQETHFFDRALETLDRNSLLELQDQKFRRLLKELAGATFFNDKLRAAANGSALQGLADLGKIPFTTKRELVEQQASFPPFGNLLTAPISQYRYFHQTSGTSGSPLVWLDTQQDWESWIRCWNYVYRAAGVTEHDVVFLAYSFGPYVSHWAAMDGARGVGALTISGAGMNSLQRLQTILGRRATVVVCTPTYALRLAEVAQENGLDIASSAVRVTIHAGEPGASVPHVRKAIQDAWGANCFDHAGATEVGAWAFECGANTGAIHLNEAEFIFEFIDPKTGQAVADGHHGELVITGLTRTGMPALRYRTGDLVNPTYEPCPCGRTWARIKGGVIGRADDMLIVRGVNVYPSAIDNVIRSIPTIVEYEVEVRRLNGMDDLTLKVETAPGSSFDEVQRSLSAAFRNSLNIRVTIEHAAAGSLPRYEMKARRYKRVP
jgi:phenylacetate-CoA ligase